MHLPSRSQRMTHGTAAICGQCSLHRISKFAVSCAAIKIIWLSVSVLIYSGVFFSLQWGGCSQPPFITTGFWGEKVLCFRENYLWGTVIQDSPFSKWFECYIFCIYTMFLQNIYSVCDVWLSGSGVLWGTLQSGLERYSISSESSGHQYPSDQLSDHREVSPPPWSWRQHEWRCLYIFKSCFAEWLIDIACFL